MMTRVSEFLRENRHVPTVPSPTKPTRLNFARRAQLCSNPIGKWVVSFQWYRIQMMMCFKKIFSRLASVGLFEFFTLCVFLLSFLYGLFSNMTLPSVGALGIRLRRPPLTQRTNRCLDVWKKLLLPIFGHCRPAQKVIPFFLLVSFFQAAFCAHHREGNQLGRRSRCHRFRRAAAGRWGCRAAHLHLQNPLRPRVRLHAASWPSAASAGWSTQLPHFRGQVSDRRTRSFTYLGYIVPHVWLTQKEKYFFFKT